MKWTVWFVLSKNTKIGRQPGQENAVSSRPLLMTMSKLENSAGQAGGRGAAPVAGHRGGRERGLPPPRRAHALAPGRRRQQNHARHVLHPRRRLHVRHADQVLLF